MCVVGPGKAFLSGMTYHTYGLVSALAAHGPTQAVLLRHLVPGRLYPGRSRIGSDLSHLRLPPTVERAGRVDWWWGPGMIEALWMLLRRPPAILVLQWWSAAVWHTQLTLAIVAKARGARVVIEIHEPMDTAEARVPLAGAWAKVIGRALLKQADRVIVHGRVAEDVVVEALLVDRSQIVIIAEPPFDHYQVDPRCAPEPRVGEVVELLFFGTIRPFKGLEDLIAAFDQLCESGDGQQWHLTVVGETWEGWTLPSARIMQSLYRDRITFVNRYVADEEVDRWFADADLVVLPYHRSFTSGPLMVAMSYGKPVVVTRVGGLPEAVENYAGAVVVDPQSPDRLVDGIRKAEQLVGPSYPAPRSWADVANEHEALYRQLGVEGRS